MHTPFEWKEIFIRMKRNIEIASPGFEPGTAPWRHYPDHLDYMGSHHLNDFVAVIYIPFVFVHRHLFLPLPHTTCRRVVSCLVHRSHTHHQRLSSAKDGRTRRYLRSVLTDNHRVRWYFDQEKHMRSAASAACKGYEWNTGMYVLLTTTPLTPTLTMNPNPNPNHEP